MLKALIKNPNFSLVFTILDTSHRLSSKANPAKKNRSTLSTNDMFAEQSC